MRFANRKNRSPWKPRFELWALVALLSCAGCFDASAASAPDAGASPRPSGEGHDGGPAQPEPPVDAGTALDASGATGSSTDASLDGSVPSMTRHASCEDPLPPLLPASPGALPGPADAGSEAPGCEPTILRSCSPEQPCTRKGDVCLHPTLQSAGVCEPHGSEPSVLLSSGEGACLRSVPADTRRALCCANVRGVDCREFGSAAVEPLSVPGQLCRVHEDCEAGLLCMADSYGSWGEGWGRCLCPGVSPDHVVDHRACTADGSPWVWGEAPLLLTGSCAEALSPGWVVEKVAKAVDSPNFIAALDGSSRLHVLHLDPEGVRHLVREPEGWTSELFAELTDLSFLSAHLTIDAAGALHIAHGAPYGSAPSYATNASGSWVIESLPLELGAHMVDIRLSAEAGAQLSFLTDYDGFYLGERSAQGWTTRLISAEQIRGFTALPAPGGLGWLMFMQDERVLWLHDGQSEPQLVLSAGSDGNGVLTPQGDLIVPYVPRDSGELRLARLHGTEESEQKVWALSDPHYDINGAIHVRAALDGTGRVFILHGTPQGLALETQVQADYDLTLLVPELEGSAHTMTAPQLFIDGRGEPHVLYWLEADTADREIRHVFRGSCPTR